MAYSGINIQSQGQGGSGKATYLDVPFLRNSGIETLGVQIKPTQRNKKLQLNNWQQALQQELDWALEIVQACNDISLRQIKVVIRFNDLADDDSGSIPMNTEDWWDINNNAMNIALDYWQQVCQKFVGQEIFMFEILSEPVVIDANGKGHAPDKATLQGFYQSALNIVRFNFIDTYFLLSTGPYGTFYAYTSRNFQPYNITDP